MPLGILEEVKRRLKELKRQRLVASTALVLLASNS